MSGQDLDDGQGRRVKSKASDEWAVAAATGGEAGFERLHGRFGHGLVRFFMKRTSGRLELSEELAQRTWVLVWRALQAGRYDPGRAAVSTFIYAVGQNVWLQHRRSSSTLPTALGDFEDLAEYVTPTIDDPAGELAAAELLDALREGIAAKSDEQALTTDERDVVRGLEAGHSERSMADRLGVAASTIHARKVSAFEKLRRFLRRRGFAGPEASADGSSRE
jgi:RNA polymerase sigma-70 factor (ECF subfamily)